jgi:hypothetical protein
MQDSSPQETLYSHEQKQCNYQKIACWPALVREPVQYLKVPHFRSVVWHSSGPGSSDHSAAVGKSSIKGILPCLFSLNAKKQPHTDGVNRTRWSLLALCNNSIYIANTSSFSTPFNHPKQKIVAHWGHKQRPPGKSARSRVRTAISIIYTFCMSTIMNADCVIFPKLTVASGSAFSANDFSPSFV